jgi:hypothetical protein
MKRSITGALTAQDAARERARQMLPPDVFEGLTSMAEELTGQGIPSEPLYNKALEGMAKRVSPDRLIPAVRMYADRLGSARRALGPTAAVPLLVAGADAIQRGVPPTALESLPSDRPRTAVAVLVLAELHESGVPTERALAVLRQALDQRTDEARMLDITARVRRLIRDGVPPDEAVDRVRRTLRRDRGRVGPPVPPGSEPTTTDAVRDRLSGIG